MMAATQAWGQMPGGGGGARGSRGGDTSRMGLPNRSGEQETMTANPVAIVQYRLDQLEDDLRLMPEQRRAWLAYRERVQRMAEDAQRAARAVLAEDLPAPKRLDRMADIARDRLTAIEDIGDAGKTLYATLTPAQQSVADRRLAVPVTALLSVEPTASAIRLGPPRSGGDAPKNP